ncbi:MAG: hypothetical protein ACYCTW_00545 [Sulfuricella sp.]
MSKNLFFVFMFIVHAIHANTRTGSKPEPAEFFSEILSGFPLSRE